MDRRSFLGRAAALPWAARGVMRMSETPQPHLKRADASLTKLRAYLRLCRDLQLLSLPQYGFASQQVAQVGRLLGGWLKAEDIKAVPAS